MNNFTDTQKERINYIFENLYNDEELEMNFDKEEFTTIDDKLEEITQYYEAAGFAFDTDDDLFSFLGL